MSLAPDCERCTRPAFTLATTRYACGEVVAEMLCDEHVAWDAEQRELYARLVAVWDQIDAARPHLEPWSLRADRMVRVKRAGRRPVAWSLEDASAELARWLAPWGGRVGAE